MTAHANLVAGKWVSGTETNRNINPSNLDDLVGEYARADAAQAREAIAAAAAAAPGWARGNLQERADLLERIGVHHTRAPHRARHAALARGGQDAARGHRRGLARRLHLQVLRGRGRPAHRREDRLHATGRGCRDHARADRGGGHHHAVELPARHPGLEDRARAGLRQLRGVQAGRSGARLRLGAGGHHQPGRRAARRVQPGHGPWARSSARRSSARPRSPA